MNDLLLKGATKLDLARHSFLDRINNRKEDGDIVQTIIIIAVFVLICIIVGMLLTDAITGQAENVSNCIENANTGKCTGFN